MLLAVMLCCSCVSTVVILAVAHIPAVVGTFVFANVLLLLASPTVAAVSATAGISSCANISAVSAYLLLQALAESDLNFVVYASTLSAFWRS
jgi:hypothetical protein